MHESARLYIKPTAVEVDVMLALDSNLAHGDFMGKDSANAWGGMGRHGEAWVQLTI